MKSTIPHHPAKEPPPSSDTPCLCGIAPGRRTFWLLGAPIAWLGLAIVWLLMARTQVSTAWSFLPLIVLGSVLGRWIGGRPNGWFCGALLATIWGVIGAVMGAIAVDVLFTTPLGDVSGWAGLGLLGVLFGGFSGGRIARRRKRDRDNA